MRCPPGATDALRARALQLNLGASALDQLIATSFLEDPQPVLSEVLARLRKRGVKSFSVRMQGAGDYPRADGAAGRSAGNADRPRA